MDISQQLMFNSMYIVIVVMSLHQDTTILLQCAIFIVHCQGSR